MTVIYNNNYWKVINLRGSTLRFGTGYIYNNHYEDVSNGINTW
jgi:pectate lyase